MKTKITIIPEGKCFMSGVINLQFFPPKCKKIDENTYDCTETDNYVFKKAEEIEKALSGIEGIGTGKVQIFVGSEEERALNGIRRIGRYSGNQL